MTFEVLNQSTRPIVKQLELLFLFLIAQLRFKHFIFDIFLTKILAMRPL